MECLVACKRPVLICGHSATGKSRLVKQFLLETSGRFSQSLLADHVTCNYRTDGVQLKDHIIRHLYTQMIQEKKPVDSEGSCDEGKTVFSENDTNRPMPSYRTRRPDQEKKIDSRPQTQSGRMLELMQKRMEEE